MRAYAVAAAALVATNALVPHSARYRRPARCQSWDDDSSARDVGRSRRADDYESALDPASPANAADAPPAGGGSLTSIASSWFY